MYTIKLYFHAIIPSAKLKCISEGLYYCGLYGGIKWLNSQFRQSISWDGCLILIVIGELILPEKIGIN